MHWEDRRFQNRELISVQITKILQLLPGLRRVIADFGALANYVNWVESRFPGTKFYGSRKRLIKLILKSVENKKVQVLELGVARGALTRWSLSVSNNSQLSWTGFDTFSGLPADWLRDGAVYLAKGSFSTDGKQPQICDSRLRFVVGDITETSKQIPSLLQIDNRGIAFVLFDLDLFNPSLVAWQEMSPYLRSGDILYFDQAFDREGEQRLIADYVLVEKRVEVLGKSVIGLALQIL